MAYKVGNAFITVAPSFDGFQDKIRAEAAKIKDITVNIVPKLDLTKVKADLERLGQKTVTPKIKVDADTAKAAAAINIVARERDSVINVNVYGDTAANAKLDYVARTRTAKVKVDVDKKSLGNLFGLLGSAQDSFNPLSRGSLTGLFSQAGVAQLAIGATPFLGPTALGGAAAAGAGIVGTAGLAGVAASMVGNITQVLSAQKDLKTATTQQQAASVSLAAAQNGVISAQESLATSVYNVGVAERNVTQAQYASKAAQLALTDAREVAQRQLEGLADSLKGAALAESGAKLAVEQAIINLQQVQRDPRATRTDVLLAEQALKEAKLRSSEASRDRTYAIEDAKKLRSEGVAGNSAVVAAKHQLATANQGIADAQHQVAVANQQVADGQRAVAQAQEQSALAQQSMADATAAVASAQSTLSPKAAQEFTKAWQGLKDTFQAFLGATSTRVLGVASKAIGVIADVLKQFGPATNAAAGALGTLVRQFARFVSGSPLFKDFLKALERFGPIFIKQFGGIAFNVFRGFLRLMIAFMPLSRLMFRGLLDLTLSFANWAKEFVKGKQFESFIDFVKENGPVVLAILGGLATIGFKLIQALAPVAAQLLKAFLPVIQWLAKQDPNVLLAIAAGITALIDPYLGLGIALAAAYGFAKELYDSNPGFKKWVDGVGSDITGFASDVKKGFEDATGAAEDSSESTYKTWHTTGMKLGTESGVEDFGTHSQKTFGDTSKSAKDNADKTTSAWDDTFTQLGELIGQAKETWDEFVDFLDGLWSVILKGWDIFGESLSTIVATFTGDVLTIIEDLLAQIGDVFEFWGDLLSGNWGDLWGDIKNLGKDGLKLALDVIMLGVHSFVAPFRLALDAIGAVWDTFWDNLGIKAAGAINWVITNVLNKLIDAINWLKNNTIGGAIEDIPPIPTVAGAGRAASTPAVHHMGGLAGAVPYAEGGVVPGYTPGRDVHIFHSATGGSIALGGGEAIMRPEWTRAVGGARAVKAMNARARQYASGGVYSPMSRFTLTQGIHDQATGFPALDLGAAIGTPVYAVAPGRVTISKDLVGYEPRISEQNGFYSYGKYIQIAHEKGYSTLSAHLAARLAQVGAQVAGGQLIGFSGLTGHTYGPHLHFGAQDASPYDFIHGSTDYLGGGGKAGPNVLSRLAGAAGGLLSRINPLDYLERKLAGLWHGAGAWVDSPLGEVVKAIPSWLLKKIVPKVFGGLLSKAGQAAGAVAGAISGPVSGPQQAQSYALSQLPSFGWGTDQFSPLVSLWNRESDWRWDALNQSSGAYGIPQSLPASKMAAAGADWRTNPITQIMWGLRYINDRYGSPAGAWAHSQATGWYDDGGMAYGQGFWPKKTLAPERILSPQTTRDFNRLVTVLDRGVGSQKVAITMTNWKDGTGWMAVTADNQIAQDRAYRDSLSYMEVD